MHPDIGRERAHVAPVQRLRRAIGGGVDDAVIAERGDHADGLAGAQAGQGGEVEMVVVVVRHQHGIDRRQGGPGDPWRVHPLRPGPGERARTVGPDGIHQQVEPGDLHQQAGMADQGHAQPGDTRRRSIGMRAGMVPWPRRLAAAEAPAQQVRQSLVGGAGAARGRFAGQVEDPAIEMVAGRALVVGVRLGHQRRYGKGSMARSGRFTGPCGPGTITSASGA